MPDLKITQLTADTTPQKADLLTSVKSPFGSGSNRKITVDNFLNNIVGTIGFTGATNTFTSTAYQFGVDTSAVFRANFPNGTSFKISGNGSDILAIAQQTPITVTQAIRTGNGSVWCESLTGASHANLTASTEKPDVIWNFNAGQQFATGALTTQRTVDIKPRVYTFVGASALTNAATVAIEGASKAGTNATITKSIGLWIQGGAVNNGGTVTKSYAAEFDVQSGATNNYTALFSGGDVQMTNASLFWTTDNTPIATNYSIGRGGTNQLIFNIPTGATNFSFTQNGTSFLTYLGTSPISITQIAATSGNPIAFTLTGAAHTGLTAATAAEDFKINLSRTISYAVGDNNGAISLVNFALNATLASAGASTYASVVGALFGGIPTAGTNVTVTTAVGVAIGSVGTTVAANSIYQLFVTPPAVANGQGNMTDFVGINCGSFFGNISLGNQTATLTNLASVFLRTVTYQSTTNTRTVTNAATLLIEGAPTSGGNVTFTNGPYSAWVKAGASRFDGRVLPAEGASIAAANSLTLGADGNTFLITGNTQINAITTSGWTAGSYITLLFSGTPTVKNNTAGGAGTAVLLLSGSADLTAANNTVLGLFYDGTQWQETFRKVA